MIRNNPNLIYFKIKTKIRFESDISVTNGKKREEEQEEEEEEGKGQKLHWYGVAKREKHAYWFVAVSSKHGEKRKKIKKAFRISST